MKSIFSMLILLLVCVNICSAEVIRLKSGKEYEGKIVDKTDEYVRMQTTTDLVKIPVNMIAKETQDHEDQAQSILAGRQGGETTRNRFNAGKGRGAIPIQVDSQTPQNMNMAAQNKKIDDCHRQTVFHSQQDLLDAVGACVEAGDLKRALELDDKIIQINPNNYYAYLSRASIYAELGRMDKADADWKIFQQLYPEVARKIGYSVYDLRDYAIAEKKQKEMEKSNNFVQQNNRPPQEVNEQNFEFWRERISDPHLSKSQKDDLASFMIKQFPSSRSTRDFLTLMDGRALYEMQKILNDGTLTPDKRKQALINYQEEQQKRMESYADQKRAKYKSKIEYERALEAEAKRRREEMAERNQRVSEGATNTQVKRKDYKSGAIESEIPYRNGLCEGVQKEYYETGELRSEIPCVGGKQDGVTKSYTKDGFLEMETFYENGKHVKTNVYYADQPGRAYEYLYQEGKLMSSGWKVK